MPYKRKYRKKPYKKRRRRGTQRSIMRQLSFTKSPLPKVFTTKLRYSASTSLNPQTAHLLGTHVYSCNGIYDPDITGIGHQPRGFDQLMPLFDHYRVIGSKIMVRFFPTDTTHGVVAGVAIRDSTTTDNILYDYAEQGTVKTLGLGTNDTTVKTIHLGVAPHKWLGLSYKDNELKGAVSSNPSEGCYFHLFAGSPNSTADPLPIYCHVDIDYLVQFVEPKDLNAS